MVAVDVDVVVVVAVADMITPATTTATSTSTTTALCGYRGIRAWSLGLRAKPALCSPWFDP
jgi:hypothetical protein